MWFELETRLNGQHHNPGWIQFRHDKIQDHKMERKSLQGQKLRQRKYTPKYKNDSK